MSSDHCNPFTELKELQTLRRLPYDLARKLLSPTTRPCQLLAATNPRGTQRHWQPPLTCDDCGHSDMQTKKAGLHALLSLSCVLNSGPSRQAAGRGRSQTLLSELCKRSKRSYSYQRITTSWHVSKFCALTPVTSEALC